MDSNTTPANTPAPHPHPINTPPAASITHLTIKTTVLMVDDPILGPVTDIQLVLVDTTTNEPQTPEQVYAHFADLTATGISCMLNLDLVIETAHGLPMFAIITDITPTHVTIIDKYPPNTPIPLTRADFHRYYQLD